MYCIPHLFKKRCKCILENKMPGANHKFGGEVRLVLAPQKQKTEVRAQKV